MYYSFINYMVIIDYDDFGYYFTRLETLLPQFLMPIWKIFLSWLVCINGQYINASNSINEKKN